MLGKSKNQNFPPIIEAISKAEAGTNAEVRVHLSKSWLEWNVFTKAIRIFRRFSSPHHRQHVSVLIYVNLRKRRFAILGDSRVHQAFGQKRWEELALNLKTDLHSTHPERAIALTVLAVGDELRKYFPSCASGH